MSISGLTGSGIVVSSSAAAAGGDFGDYNGWTGSDLDDAIASAGASLANADRVSTLGEDWYALVNASPLGTHYVPRSVPVSITQPTPAIQSFQTLWRGVDPSAEGVSDWDKTLSSGASTYTVADGRLTIASPVASAVGYLDYDDGVSKLDGPRLIVMDRVSAVAASATLTNRPQIQFRFVEADRYLALRPGGTSPTSLWGIVVAGANVDIVGATIGTEHRIELHLDPVTQAVRVRVDGGAWQAPSITWPTVVDGTRSIAAYTTYTGGAQSISIASMLVVVAT